MTTKELIRRNEYCLNYLFEKDQRDPAVQDIYHRIMNRIIELENEIRTTIKVFSGQRQGAGGNGDKHQSTPSPDKGRKGMEIHDTRNIDGENRKRRN